MMKEFKIHSATLGAMTDATNAEQIYFKELPWTEKYTFFVHDSLSIDFEYNVSEACGAAIPRSHSDSKEESIRLAGVILQKVGEKKFKQAFEAAVKITKPSS